MVCATDRRWTTCRVECEHFEDAGTSTTASDGSCNGVTACQCSAFCSLLTAYKLATSTPGTCHVPQVDELPVAFIACITQGACASEAQAQKPRPCPHRRVCNDDREVDTAPYKTSVRPTGRTRSPPFLRFTFCPALPEHLDNDETSTQVISFHVSLWLPAHPLVRAGQCQLSMPPLLRALDRQILDLAIPETIFSSFDAPFSLSLRSQAH